MGHSFFIFSFVYKYVYVYTKCKQKVYKTVFLYMNIFTSLHTSMYTTLYSKYTKVYTKIDMFTKCLQVYSCVSFKWESLWNLVFFNTLKLVIDRHKKINLLI